MMVTDRYGRMRVTQVVTDERPSVRLRVEREMQARVGASSPPLVRVALDVIEAHDLSVRDAVRWATREL